MPRKPDTLCAGGCGALLWGGRGSLAPGGPGAWALGSRLADSGSRKARRAAGIEKEKVNRIGGNNRRRARHYGVPYEPVDRTAVFERDGWMCGICGLAVDRALSFPDRMSVSLDHVVPMARGGGHLEANTQCAHWICNVEKGAREEVPHGLAV